jgi:CheY-like chemotaxis protein
MDTIAVLVVDNDADMRMTVRQALEDEQYVVFEAPDGPSALNQLRSASQPMVVLLDLLMPGLDGIAVLHALAADTTIAHRHTYILFTAASDAENVLSTGVPADLRVSLLAKPFDIDELLAVVAQAVNQIAVREIKP